jgi:hypothetical protein
MNFIFNKNLYDDMDFFITLFVCLTEPMVMVDGEGVFLDGILSMQDNPVQNDGYKTPPAEVAKSLGNPPRLKEPKISDKQPDAAMIRQLVQMGQNLEAWLADPNHVPQKLERRNPRQP